MMEYGGLLITFILKPRSYPPNLRPFKPALQPHPVNHCSAVSAVAIDDGVVMNIEPPAVDENFPTGMTEGLLALLSGNIAGIDVFQTGTKPISCAVIKV